MKGKIKPTVNFIIIFFLTMFILINQTSAEEEPQTSQITTQRVSDSTRIVISTSGGVKFNSYWLNNPYRLMVEFKSRNVVGSIDKEMVVNQGFIKKITASYFNSGRTKALRTLTFELAEKVPYKIWQEGNTILLDIQAPLETTGFSVGAKETITETESSNVIKRLEAMDTALKQTQEAQASLEPLGTQVTNETLKDFASKQVAQTKVIPLAPPKVKKNILGIILWFIGIASISGLGLLFWRKYAVIRTKNMVEMIKELKLQLEKKEKLLEQVEIIRKTVEKTAIEKEKEYEQLKLELQEKNELFVQEEAIRKEKERALLELEGEYKQLKETSESLKDVLVKRGIARRLTLPEEKGELWILGKSPERRNFPRLALTKDFHNTVIVKVDPSTLLRVKLPGSLKQTKSFAENISSGGLCFETKSELDEKKPLNLRLFFYGGKVPNFRTQGWIVWKKTQDSKNYYGITFEGLSENVKSELQHYIETNIAKG